MELDYGSHQEGGVPDPLGPQGYPSVSSQQQGGGFQESQRPWTNSESMYLGQGLSLPSEAINEGACGPASQAHAPELIHHPLPGPAEVSTQCGYKQASQDALRFSSTSPFPSPIAGAQVHLVMENGSLALPLCQGSDGTSDMVQPGFSCSWLQVQDAREEGKASAKVLVGWGKGSCGIGHIVPQGKGKSPWLPCFLSGEGGSATTRSPPLAPVLDQGKDQGQGPCPAPAPPAPTQTNAPALETTPVPAAVEPYTCHPDHPTNSTVITKGLTQDPLFRKCGNQLSVLLESSNVVTSCQNKEKFSAQEKLPTLGPTQKKSPGHAEDFQVTRRQVLPKQPEKPAEKPLVFTSTPSSSTPVSGMLGTPKFPKVSSQSDQQPLNICNNTCSSVPLSACQVNCHKQSPALSPKEAMQTPPSTTPTCQLREAGEDNVLVFDMATGNSRMGLMYHDPMGSRAVLVGLMPKHSSIYAPEDMPSPQRLAVPSVSHDSHCPGFWPISSVLSRQVPSSLSSGSYREVALVPKEARLNLDSPVAELPVRVGMLTGPVPLGTPLQLGERTLNWVPDPGCSQPDAEKKEYSHTMWMLDASEMQDSSMVQAKKLQWMNSTQEAPRSLLREETGSCSWKEVNTTHPDNPRAEGTRQDPRDGWPPLAEQHPLSGQPPPTGWPPCAKQPSLTKQHPLPGQPPFSGTAFARQFPLTGQPPFSQELPMSKEPILSGGSPPTREAGQASTLHQEGEASGVSTHVGVLQMALAPEKACVYVSGERVGIGGPPGSSTHQLSPLHPGSSPRAQEEQLSLITFTAPGTGYKILPVAMVGTQPQGRQLKLTAKDITDPSVVAKPGQLPGAYYELVSSTESLPVQSPVFCGHSLGPYQDMMAVVIDTGTGFTKYGLSGEDHALNMVPSRVQLLEQRVQHQPRYAMPENREGSYPVLNRGVVSDWDALEVLWQYLFYCRLGVQPEELAVLVADSPISPRTNREKVAEILFERFHVPAMQTVHQALLALYAYGRTTGLVLGSGHGTSYVAPILTGDLAPLDTYRLDVAGADLTEYLAQLLLEGGHPLLEKGLVNQIKETCCYVALDMKAEMARAQAQARVNFMLPDQQVITLGSECFRCPETLFQPSLLDLNQPGLPQLALLSISRLEARQQQQLLANVVLDGGSTLVSGFPERLRQELGPGATVLGSPHRAVAAWLGGSIMASRDSFQSLWLSRQEYEEEGPWAIYKYHL